MQILGLTIKRNRATKQNPETTANQAEANPAETRAADSSYMQLIEGLQNNLMGTGANYGVTAAMSFAAVFRAVELRAETVASLPINIVNVTPNGRQINDADPLKYMLGARPNNTQTAFTFWQTLQIHTDLWGNGFALITRNNSGQPAQLTILMPWDTTVTVYDGKLWYNHKGTMYPQEDIIHIAGLGFDGVVGKSRIAMHRETVNGGLAASRTNAKFWENGAFFRGVLEMPGFLEKQGRAEKVSQDFANTWGGNNAWGVPVLHGGAKFTPIAMPHRDAQYIEGVKFTVEEVARIFNVPLHKLKSSEGANYAGNVEQMQIEWVTDTVRPLVKKYENELEVKLLPAMAAKRIHFNIDGLLRGDLKTRAEYYKNLFYIGALSPDEIRNYENLNSRPGGAEYFTPVNMYDAEQLELVKQQLAKNE